MDHAYGTVDPDWETDKYHRKSVIGISIYLAGTLVIFCSHFQPTVSQISTESKFFAASDAGKLTLYLCSILKDFNVEQIHAMELYEDNQATIAMSNLQRPSRQTRHLDIKYIWLIRLGRDESTASLLYSKH